MAGCSPLNIPRASEGFNKFVVQYATDAMTSWKGHLRGPASITTAA
jgi:maltoporin